MHAEAAPASGAEDEVIPFADVGARGGVGGVEGVVPEAEGVEGARGRVSGGVGVDGAVFLLIDWKWASG